MYQLTLLLVPWATDTNPLTHPPTQSALEIYNEVVHDLLAPVSTAASASTRADTPPPGPSAAVPTGGGLKIKEHPENVSC